MSRICDRLAAARDAGQGCLPQQLLSGTLQLLLQLALMCGIEGADKHGRLMSYCVKSWPHLICCECQPATGLCGA